MAPSEEKKALFVEVMKGLSPEHRGKMKELLGSFCPDKQKELLAIKEKNPDVSPFENPEFVAAFIATMETLTPEQKQQIHAIIKEGNPEGAAKIGCGN
jgi:hypothetical protein